MINISIPNVLEEPKWSMIGEDVFNRTYSRIKPDGSRESWADTVKRVVDGNCNFIDKRYIEKGEPEKLFDLIYNFSFLPGGRHLWVTGIKDRQFISNCWTSGFDANDFTRHFIFMFSRLLEGGGVGANYSNQYFKPYGVIKRPIDLHVVCREDHKDIGALEKYVSKDYSQHWDGCCTIADSREGWVDALGYLLDAYYDNKRDSAIVFDVSHIRPAGSQIKGFGVTASGPEALVEMLVGINAIMNKYIGKKPNSVLAMELDHEVARCVVAGNVRRAARMSMKYWKDEDILEFISLKQSNTGHWTTNMSVIVDSAFWKAIRQKDKYARKILKEIANGSLKNGEPGIFNMTKSEEGELYPVFSSNPCGEITLPQWGSCNLGNINLKNFVNKKSDMLEAFRLASRFLIRATYADYPNGDVLKIIERDRRIGVGFTGFADWLAMNGVLYSQFPHEKEYSEMLSEAKQQVRDAARKYAFELRIPEPVKVTSVAPTGTTSKLCGVSEGLQPILFKYYKRRVNFSTVDEASSATLDRLEKEGYEVEISAYTPDTTKVVSYYCKANILNDVEESMIEEAEDITLEDLLAVQSTVQECYADNSISFTININANEVTVKELERAIVAFGPHLKGTTIMPMISDRPQMPYEKITKKQFEESAIKISDTMEHGCKNGVCNIITKNGDEKT